jgi:hypothetical protein
MCCFSKPTTVHGTRIFARRTGPTSQALVYQMTYESHEATAMILPLPVPPGSTDASVRWKNLKEYPALFEDLERGFPAIERHMFGSKGVTAAASADSQLAVHEVGDYIASFVPTVADFDRVDPRFAIGKDVWSAIPAYADYGFAVFQLTKLAGSTHPIAFEFDTRSSDLYFPTVHIHDGTVHPKDDFDHVLYLQDGAFDTRVSDYEGPDKTDRDTGLVRSKGQASTFVDAARAQGILSANFLVHKTTMMGLLPNTDTFVKIPSPKPASGGCGRCDAAGGEPHLGPAVLAAAGLSWLIGRRNTLRKRDR